MLFLDSSVLIAFFSNNEECHERAVVLLNGAASENLVVSDHVLDEVMTFLARRIGGEAAFDAGQELLSTPNVELAFASGPDLQQAMFLVKKHGFSLCDGLSVSLMRRLGLRKIVSFDSDFDKISGVSRIR